MVALGSKLGANLEFEEHDRYLRYVNQGMHACEMIHRRSDAKESLILALPAELERCWRRYSVCGIRPSAWIV